ncbi:LuxR C-terminal-related transcriptional regulator [Actinoplanes sp. GCM10030250]|uniref:helix-turn-helix transcriptional regulator n=1 Tax=Actinoplanes sp. GCM10030250 TaxID=3273376 RepID=UPI003605BF42
MLVLEDMHWAGDATVQLLIYLVERLPDARILIILTCRSTAPDRSELLTRQLAQLRRLDGVHQLDLEGMETGDIVEYLGVSRRQAADLRERTGGNPFFLRELWRELLARGVPAGRITDTPVPQSVRDAFQIRLDTFPAEQRRVLEFAAVAGDDIDITAVSSAAGVPAELTLDTLDRAVAGCLVERRPPAPFRFVHALARQGILELAAPSLVVRAHARVAEVIESRQPLTGERIQQLAHHYARAHVLGYRTQAVRYLTAAAEIAGCGLAHADAGALLEQAAGLADAIPQSDALLLEAAHRYMLGADFARARDLNERVAAHSEGALLLRAAIGLEEASWWIGRPGQQATDVLTRALSEAPHDATYVRGLGSLSRALAFSGAVEQAEQVSARAAHLARERGDEELLAHVLLAQPEIIRLTLVNPEESADAAMRRARSLWELAKRTGNATHLGPGAYHRAVRAYLYGWPEDVAAALADLVYYARVSGQPVLEYQAACMTYARQFVTGDFAGAELSSVHAYQLGRQIGSSNTEGPHGLQMFMLRRETGGLDVIRPLVTGQEDPAGHWAPGLLATYTELGRRQDTARLLRWIIDEQLTAHQRSSSWPGVLAFLAEATVAIEDEPTARRLRPMIAEYAGCNLISGGFDAVFGSADRYLGALDSLTGEHDPEASFAAATEMDSRMAAPVHVAHTLLARLCHARRGTSAPAPELARQTREAARVAGSIRTARAAGPAEAGPRDTGPDGLTRREREVLALIAQGLGNRQIAARLFITENTAANHVRSILLKTGSANRTQAARYATSHGLL